MWTLTTLFRLQRPLKSDLGDFADEDPGGVGEAPHSRRSDPYIEFLKAAVRTCINYAGSGVDHGRAAFGQNTTPTASSTPTLEPLRNTGFSARSRDLRAILPALAASMSLTGAP